MLGVPADCLAWVKKAIEDEEKKDDDTEIQEEGTGK
jgi:hypothetical protein